MFMSPSVQGTLPWMAVLGVTAVASVFGQASRQEGAPVPARANAQNGKLRFVLLHAATKLPDGVTLYLQDTKQPSDRVLLAIAAADRAVLSVRLELQAGSEVVFPYQKVDIDVHPGGLTVTEIVLEKKVIADAAEWDRYWAKPGQLPPDHPRVKVARFFAIVK